MHASKSTLALLMVFVSVGCGTQGTPDQIAAVLEEKSSISVSGIPLQQVLDTMLGKQVALCVDEAVRPKLSAATVDYEERDEKLGVVLRELLTPHGLKYEVQPEGKCVRIMAA